MSVAVYMKMFGCFIRERVVFKVSCKVCGDKSNLECLLEFCYLFMLLYSLHVYASQLNLNYSRVADEEMMVLVEIVQESKAVSHCDLLSDVALCFICEGYWTFCCALFFCPLGTTINDAEKDLPRH